MSFPDQAWDTSLENWQPTGSFREQIPTPALAPNAGTLVTLPCINQEWVMMLIGCVTQLQNPSVWGSVADSIRDQLLGWVTQLQEMLWSAVDNPCCNVAMRLESGCVLQFSTDGGVTWHDVTDWATNFGPCVRSSIPAPAPPNPRGNPTAQRACDLAGYLAAHLIEVTMQKMVSYVGTTGEQLQFATDVLQTIGYAFPITYQAANAFYQFYNDVVSQLLSQVSFVSTDAVFWSQVTCAIYDAIKAVGYVDASNFAQVQTNLGSMSYTYVWAVTAVHNYWGELGLTNIQAAQDVGALDTVDCTGCASWCQKFDFAASASGWSQYQSGSEHVGSGWQSAPFSGFEEVSIQITGITPFFMTDMVVQFTTSFASGGAARTMYGYLGGTQYGHADVDPSAQPTGATSGWHSINHSTDEMIVRLRNATPGQTIVIDSIEIAGTGTPPSGLTVVACTYPVH